MERADLGAPAYSDLSHVWRECVDLAWEAHVAGSLPIAAVVVDSEGSVVARGRNRLNLEVARPPHVPGTPYIAGVPLAHAEVNALLEYGYRRPGEPRPTLYTTMEPCPLCMGAFAAGRLLREGGELDALAASGAPAEEAWRSVLQALEDLGIQAASALP